MLHRSTGLQMVLLCSLRVQSHSDTRFVSVHTLLCIG